MKRILQRFQISAATDDEADNSVIPAAGGGTDGEYSLSNRFWDGYARVTGVFVMNETEGADLGKVYCHLTIGGIEILPKEVALSMLEFNGNYSLKDATYDFSADKIPARSTDFEFEFINTQAIDISLSVYFWLEND